MSYCRWSSDDYQCDAYVWADVSGGWHTHIAGRRWCYTTALPEPAEPDADAWVERHLAVLGMHGDPAHGHWVDLPEPEGGRSYHHGTPGECADNLERLRAGGLNIPQYAIDALREEQRGGDR